MTLIEKINSPRFRELVDEVKMCCLESMVAPTEVARKIAGDDASADDKALMLYAVIVAQADALTGMSGLLVEATTMVVRLRAALSEVAGVALSEVAGEAPEVN